MAPSEEAGVVEAAARDASTASTKQRVSVFTGLECLASGPDGGSDWFLSWDWDLVDDGAIDANFGIVWNGWMENMSPSLSLFSGFRNHGG